MFVKICGTTSLDDAQLAVEAEADALGFIFAPSKRQVTVEQAAAIARALPAGVGKVGVFVEPILAELLVTVREVGLTAVQLHGQPALEFVSALRQELDPGVAIWQVVGFEVAPGDVGVAERNFVRTLSVALGHEAVDVILLDAVVADRSGGMGVAFPWRRAAELVELARGEARRMGSPRAGFWPPLVLAGGLREENVGEAVQTMRPWGVDVVSGVEASPGRKSPDRLRAFVKAARA